MSTAPNIPPPPDGSAIVAQSGGAIPPPPDGSAIVAQSAGQNTNPSQTGEITNDVGNTVIVPKDGESYLDTVKRAVQHVHSMSPEQQQSALDRETATMPGKAATVLAAAPLIGAGGAAALAAPGAVVDSIPEAVIGAEKYLQISETALEHLADNYPQLTKLATKLGYGAGATAAYKLLNKLGIH